MLFRHIKFNFKKRNVEISCINLRNKRQYKNSIIRQDGAAAGRFSLFRLIFCHYGRIWISFIYPEALMDSLKFWSPADYIYDTSDRQGYDSKITFPNAIAAGEK